MKGRIALAALIALVLSLAGGVLGERFHRALDREELEEADPQAEPKPETDTETAETKADTDTARDEAAEAEERKVGTPA